jgi:ketosteroid isomerase-like protein
VPKITVEQVKAAVERFWGAFSTKSEDVLADFYGHESSVFGSSAVRAEPGRLAATRRKREYFNPSTTVKATLGPIEVLLLGESAAVASYTFQFQATKVASATGASDEKFEHGRATQVFAYDLDGELRIMHEHLSIAGR